MREDGKRKKPLSSTEAFKGHCVHCFQEGYEKGKKDAVKHGHWIEGYPTDTTDYFSCSVCNAGIFVDNSWRVSHKDVSEIHRYCRGCGAKMDDKPGGDSLDGEKTK